MLKVYEPIYRHQSTKGVYTPVTSPKGEGDTPQYGHRACPHNLDGLEICLVYNVYFDFMEGNYHEIGSEIR